MVILGIYNVSWVNIPKYTQTDIIYPHNMTIFDINTQLDILLIIPKIIPNG